jgi:hypothetical protein
LVTGSSGIFQVAVNGTVVSERSAAGFPTEDEIIGAVEEALASPG